MWTREATQFCGDSLKCILTAFLKQLLPIRSIRKVAKSEGMDDY
jgi:hypothetical protein